MSFDAWSSVDVRMRKRGRIKGGRAIVVVVVVVCSSVIVMGQPSDIT